MKLLVSAVLSGIALAGYSTGTFAATSFAVVSDTGSLVRGDDAVSVRKTGTGKYTVTFNDSVRDCAFVVTLGSPTTQPPPTGFASTALNSSSNKKVDVVTHRADGNNSAKPFHLVVVCP
jgi:hypothetical protein